MNKFNWSIDLERRRMTTTGENKGRFHIKLWVTFRVKINGINTWKQRPYKTGMFCTEDEFKLVTGTKSKQMSTRLNDIYSKINQLRVDVEKVINRPDVTDQKSFEHHFLSGHSVESVAGHFETKIKELDLAKKYSSKEKYETALRSFIEFFSLSNTPFTFSECTPDRLQAYEDWYTSQFHGKNKKSLTSVGINTRNLRHIFNRVIKSGLVPMTVYPFGLGRYVIPEGGDDTKKFLDSEEKDAFINWTGPTDEINRLHDYIKFSYYAYGINLSDVARLKKSDINREYISINRQKTKGRKKKSRKLIIPIHPVMREIIVRCGKRSLNPDDYVFPILELDMDERTIFYTIRSLVNDVNEVLAMIGNQLNFEIKPTSYTIRHTFSFQFMQLGGTTDELQDALAHGSSKTTENYKHGFALEKKKKFSEGL